MKIALAQINPTVGDLAGNLKLIQETYNTAAVAGADLVIFPELTLTGYPPRDLLNRPWWLKKCREATEILTVQTNKTGIVFGTPLSEEGKLYNTAILAAEGKIIHIHRKVLLPGYDVFDETRYFTPGKECRICHFCGKKIGIIVCEDGWNTPANRLTPGYKRDPVAELAEQGADLLINISASPFQTGKHVTRRETALYHAQKHSLPIALVNQTGGNDELLFDGCSFYLMPDGSESRCRPFNHETLLLETENFQLDPPREQSEIAMIHDALVTGIRDYVKKCGFSSVLIGLSGGIDSAVTAALAVEAVGPEKTTGITMPSDWSSPGSVDDSAALAKNLGITMYTLPIGSLHDSFLKTLEPLFQGTEPGVAEENLQARARGSLLMAVSNKTGHLLLTTGNKSELSVGYCTLYGDMNGGLAVLGDLLKSQVYQLARYINRRKEIIPENTIIKPPSAELRPDQKDSDSLPDYEILDDILDRYLIKMESIKSIITAGHTKETVEWIVKAVDRNEYKRRQAPPVLKISGKAFGMGRRMPIAAKITAPENP